MLLDVASFPEFGFEDPESKLNKSAALFRTKGHVGIPCFQQRQECSDEYLHFCIIRLCRERGQQVEGGTPMPGLVFQNGSQLLNQQSHQWLSRCGIHELQDRCCCGFLSVTVCIEEKRCDGRQDLKVSGKHKGPQGVQGLDPNVPEALLSCSLLADMRTNPAWN